MLVYLNGEYLPHAEARIPVDDRGFLFADGVYEVTAVYDGRPFLLREHLDRMAAGLAALRIGFDGVAGLADVAHRLLDENGLGSADATIYMQVTRGAAPRKHAFPPADTAPTVYAAAKPLQPHPDRYFTEGVGAITLADTRWARCDIKSTALLPNVLANQQAKDAGAFEALFVRDGVVLEGSHANLFAVRDGTLLTYPRCNYILGGITRDRLISLAGELGIPVREAPLYADQFDRVDELFLSGTTTEAMPVTRVDGRPVADGAPGPVTRELLAAYRALARSPGDR